RCVVQSQDSQSQLVVAVEEIEQPTFDTCAAERVLQRCQLECGDISCAGVRQTHGQYLSDCRILKRTPLTVTRESPALVVPRVLSNRGQVLLTDLPAKLAGIETSLLRARLLHPGYCRCSWLSRGTGKGYCSNRDRA